MGIYIGNSKIKFNVGGLARRLKITTSSINVTNILIKSIDNYILKDSKGLYITAKGDK